MSTHEPPPPALPGAAPGSAKSIVLGIADRAELKERREIARGAPTASCAASINRHLLVSDVVPQLLEQLRINTTGGASGSQTLGASTGSMAGIDRKRNFKDD